MPRKPLYLIGGFIVVAISFAGCNDKSSLSSPPAIAPTKASEAVLLDFVLRNSEGTRGEVFAPDFGGHVAVDVGGTYIAASGRSCKRFNLVSRPSGPVRTMAACQNGAGWILVAPYNINR